MNFPALFFAITGVLIWLAREEARDLVAITLSAITRKFRK
jgi:hypothetical protein